MKKIIISIICVALAVCIISGGIIFYKPNIYNNLPDSIKNTEKASWSGEYSELSENKTNKTDTWRQGMISGYGIEGVVTSGSPYSDSLIYQNIHFIMPNKNVRYCPETYDELETVKQKIVAGEDITDNASYDDVYSFHPGAALRISQKKLSEKDYIRYTDYETAQVGVKYTDKNGTWERTTFTSKADNVTITKIGSSSTGKKVNLTLSMDDITSFANYGNGSEVDLKYNKVAIDSQGLIAMVAHYPNYENSELKNGGYGTLVYIICEGGTKKSVISKNATDEQCYTNYNPQIEITDADNVYLIAVSDRTYDMGDYDTFTTDNALLDTLYERAKSVGDKYTKDSVFDYSAALSAHTAIFTKEYNALTFSLGEGSSEKSNEALITSARFTNKVSSSLYERAYNSGRYAYLCSSGYSTPRLSGMWTGEWNPGWGSKYTMDANVNLQTSSMNIGNMKSSAIGYASFILRQVPDWEENAAATHGYKDCIQAPVNTDGDKAVLTETCYPYPFRYWNAGASWMLQPLYETLECYGDLSIPINGEYDLQSLRSVLSLTEKDLTDKELQLLSDKGELDLRSDILLPLLIKSANYWDELMSPEYYTDNSGSIHYEKGKTELSDNEKYAILPSYSPENNPSNYASPSTANCAIDIAACKNNLTMLINIMKSVDKNADVSHWETLLSKVPEYLYDESGALKEWACNEFEENNRHRHLSHLYCAWPLFETQGNKELTAACEQAIENRNSENEASHALVHRALIAARLKDSEIVTASLKDLMTRRIYYNSLMTNHDYDRGSCYCTDFAIGYLGIINESLVYSNNGTIELFPSLPENGFESGKVCGLRTRTRVEITELNWNLNDRKASVTITSDIAQTITVSCAISEKSETVTFKAGEIKTISFEL